MNRPATILAAAALALTLTTAPAEAAARVCNSTASHAPLAIKQGTQWRTLAPGPCAGNVSTVMTPRGHHGHAVLRPAVVRVHNNNDLAGTW